MNAKIHIDNYWSQPMAEEVERDLEHVALFNALGLKEPQIEELTAVWEQCAPEASLPEFTRALVTGGMKLASKMA